VARDRAGRPEAKPLRLFIAVDVPEPVKATLAAAAAPFRQTIPGGRWTRPEAWHVTLKFLGRSWPRLVPAVEEAVRSAAEASERFETRLTELGVFPGPGRARVIWAGLWDPDGKFPKIVKLLDESLGGVFEPEKRAFTPHLTLARLNPPTDIREVAPTLIGHSVTAESFTVGSLVLYRSHLSPRGATYEPLLSAPLSGPDDPRS